MSSCLHQPALDGALDSCASPYIKWLYIICARTAAPTDSGRTAKLDAVQELPLGTQMQSPPREPEGEYLDPHLQAPFRWQAHHRSSDEPSSIPIFRHTSTIGVPPSACLDANAICSSAYLDFFMVLTSKQRPDCCRKTLTQTGSGFGFDRMRFVHRSPSIIRLRRDLFQEICL